VNPDLVVRDSDGEIYTVRYDSVNAMLLNEFLKEHRKKRTARMEDRLGILSNSSRRPTGKSQERANVNVKIVAISFRAAIAFNRLGLTPCPSLLPSPFTPANH